jgi:hypothetical protein
MTLGKFDYTENGVRLRMEPTEDHRVVVSGHSADATSVKFYTLQHPEYLAEWGCPSPDDLDRILALLEQVRQDLLD